MSVQPRWIDLDGAANVRDLGGLPAGNGTVVRPGRLIRSDNLQGLTASDVERLVGEHGVRSVADLRTATEVVSEGPGPLTREPRVRIEHLSLLPEAGDNTDVLAAEAGDGPVILPWQKRDRGDRRSAAAFYQLYL
jgi:protein-tyrosine phosphatase